MTADEILKNIAVLHKGLFVDRGGETVPARPEELAKRLLLIRIETVKLVEYVAQAELDYRHEKSARFDKFLKDGMKRSPAMDSLEMEGDLIDMKINTERLKNYMKHIDGLCTTLQSYLKFEQNTNV